MKHSRWLLAILVFISAVPAFAIARGQKWEQTITTNQKFNWTTDQLCVQYTSPSGKIYKGLGYWESRGATTDTYKIRAVFDEQPGTWGWAIVNGTGCISTTKITGTSSGSVVVSGDTTGLPLLANGPVRVSTTGHYLIYGTSSSPFQWIGDTSWAGPHSAPIATWQTYTTDRKNKGFSVVQVAIPLGSGAITHVDNGTHPFYDPAGTNVCDSGQLPRAACLPKAAFWQAWDAHIDDVNAKGMLASVIGLYKRMDDAANWPTVDDSKGFARFIAARLAGNYTTLAPGFDEIPNVTVGDFTTNCLNVVPGTENQACRAREIGNAIKSAIILQTSPTANVPLSALVTHHMGGGGCTGGTDGTSGCVADQWMSTFHAETWLDFDLIQSGQGLNAGTTQQPDAIALRSSRRFQRLYSLAPAKPVIDGEGIYDNNGVKQCGVTNANYDAAHGRQSAFNALLSGAAGYTHGIGGTWDWNGYWTCLPVSNGLTAASGTQIGKLKAAFSTLAWQRLVPDCQQWGTPCTDILNPTQATDLARFKRMYAVDSVGRLAVAFLPIGVSDPSLKLNLDNLAGYTAAAPWATVWYNPRSSCTCSATPISNGGTTWTFTRPNSTVDWALIIRNTNFMAGLGVGACVPADCP